MRYPSLPLFTLALSVFAALSAGIAADTEIRHLSGTGPEDAVEWDFFCTGGRNSGAWRKIPVPSCWEQHGFGTYNYGRNMDPRVPVPFADEQGKYRLEFTAPAAWRDKQVRIVFDGSMTDTDVWINGQSAGPTHQGAFYQFHYDITSLLKFGDGDAGKNLLEVTVAKMSANKSVNQAEREADYWVFGGIFRPVWLEARPKQHIEWTAIDARADGSFLAQVHLGGPIDRGATVDAAIIDASGATVGEPMSVELPAGSERARLRTVVPHPRLWTAETPHLYRVEIRLVAAGGGVHTVTERFGFRTIEVRENDGVYLNGTKIVLKGVNRHCFWPETGRTLSREQSYADARLIKEANMNAVRMSHYPPDKHFLEACDELGLYVLHELAGWQAAYDTPTGARLIGQLVRRDVNHPCVLFWDNGNEGGWNTANDGEFAKWDPQQRTVLHPWAIHGGINTDHYEKYDSTVRLSAGPTIFMPTEMLHGLWDGGIGAGFRDYWDVMGKSPTVAGAFFWVWADEGLVRTDQNGRIDNADNRAPDGIVGPHREKEGSFFVLKEIWSPVQITAESNVSSRRWDGTIAIANHYDFVSLDQCALEWRLISTLDERHNLRQQPEIVARGQMAMPAIRPRESGSVRLPLTDEARARSDILQVISRGPTGEELWVSSWSLGYHGFQELSSRMPRQVPVGDGDSIVIGGFEFDRATGALRQVRVQNRVIPFGNGPRFVAYRRDGRTYASIAPTGALKQLERWDNGTLVANYDGPLKWVRWRINGASATMSYEYEFTGDADLVGVCFDFPEKEVTGKSWRGPGPYRVYRNRLEGGVLDVHRVAYNDPIPGETFEYPEFRGYFRDCTHLDLSTKDGTIAMNVYVPFVGLYAPRDGEPSMLAFPDTGIAFLDVIPAIGTKFDFPEQLGPQSRTPHVSGVKTGSVIFKFEPK